MKTRTLLTALTTLIVTAILSRTTSVFVENVSVSDIYKNLSSISISNGTAEFIFQREAEFEDEHINEVLVSKQVDINTQKISSDNGTLKIKNGKEISYKGLSKAIVDIKLDIKTLLLFMTTLKLKLKVKAKSI